MKFTSFPFVSTIRLGIKSLMLHKLRSVLTMLGIIFGVCSVIAMLAIGEGASYQAQEEIKKLGSQNIIIRSLKPVDDANRANASRSSSLEYGLTYDDGARIQAHRPRRRPRACPFASFARMSVSPETASPARSWEPSPPTGISLAWTSSKAVSLRRQMS